MVSTDMAIEAQRQVAYRWPDRDLKESAAWSPTAGQAHSLEMPESRKDLAVDSRWPAFFPSSICLVTTSDGNTTALEKVVGASIVNRFPYVVALSFCRESLSQRHHARTGFMEVLERGECAAVQFLDPGPVLSRTLEAIQEIPTERSHARLGAAGLKTRQAHTNRAPVIEDAFMVYEARFVKPSKDFDGHPIYETPWADVGSHRIYFLEITAIQLRQDIASGENRIYWRSLPSWTPQIPVPTRDVFDNPALAKRYTKAFTPHYVFPSRGTVAFEADGFVGGMAIKCLPPVAADQVELDNDRARWPCFFPSSAALITTWMPDGVPNFMPCGSTTVVSRHPMVIAPCVSYSEINQRYAPRATLGSIDRNQRFGCGVPYIHDAVLNAIRYAGNVSFDVDPNKAVNSGLEICHNSWAPLLPALPIHYECEVVGRIRLGTHIMFLGEVRRIRVRDDVGPQNAMEWFPFAEINAAEASGCA